MEAAARPHPVVLLILLLLSLGAIGMAWAGWCQYGEYQWWDALYLAIKTVAGSEPYNDLVLFHSESYWLLNWARWMGIIVETSGIVLIFYSLFNERWIRLSASWKHGHVVVVGDSPFADRLSETQKGSVVHLRSLDDEVHCKDKLIRLPFGGYNAEKLHDAATKHAATLIIAPEKDSDALDLAISAQHLYRHDKVQVIVRLRDYWLAQRLHNVPGAERLRAISEPDLAATDVVRRFPPYLLAQDYGHKRIHALLIGDHDWLEAIMAEIILSACTLTFGKSAFSFICREPEIFSARLLRHYPELETQADIAFYSADHLHNNKTFDVDMDRLTALGPVTCVYSVFADGADAMSNALIFRDQAKMDVNFQAPIFVMMGGKSLSDVKPGSRLKALDMIQFGALEDMSEASGLLAQEADMAERDYHAAYLTFSAPGGAASTPWDELTEEFRISNRRAVAHIYAKLFEAGFDLRSWMATHDIWRELPALALGENLCRTAQDRERLAILEHDRWIADRRLSGWRYGEPRDNARKLHPDIKPFEQLSVPTQDYDRRFIDLLQQILKHDKHGMTRG